MGPEWRTILLGGWLITDPYDRFELVAVPPVTLDQFPQPIEAQIIF